MNYLRHNRGLLHAAICEFLPVNTIFHYNMQQFVGATNLLVVSFQTIFSSFLFSFLMLLSSDSFFTSTASFLLLCLFGNMFHSLYESCSDYFKNFHPYFTYSLNCIHLSSLRIFHFVLSYCANSLAHQSKLYSYYRIFNRSSLIHMGYKVVR